MTRTPEALNRVLICWRTVQCQSASFGTLALYLTWHCGTLALYCRKPLIDMYFLRSE